MLHFIDHTGHIFGLDSYDSYPIGYEYEEHPYIFWVNNEYSTKLSVKNYYILPIRFICEHDITSVDITVDSNIYSFGLINENNLEINESDLVKSITDVSLINVMRGIPSKTGTSKNFNIYTFYVFATSLTEGTWLSNVLINYTFNSIKDGVVSKEIVYCPITIGSIFVDEIEELQINARNMGIKLPKDICRAIYQESYYNSEINESLYNDKLKEYLINHMLIKGECGNYNSVLASLKWFGWGDTIQISKFLKTDNEFYDQFIHDYFNIINDVPKAFHNFKQSTYISLYVSENAELDTVYPVISDSESTDFWGEGKPHLENLFEKTFIKQYDECDISFVASYYKYMIHEMMYKLSCLSYMFKKYFLPIHLFINSASVRHQVFANDIKFITNTNTTITETPIFAIDQTNGVQTNVEFPNETVLYLFNQDKKYLDTNFNSFEHYTDEYCNASNDIFYTTLENVSVRIPITFTGADVYNCVLILSEIHDAPEIKNDETITIKKQTTIFESHFTFSSNDKYDSFNIIPAAFNKSFDVTNWESTFCIDILCNDKWYSYEFDIRIPDMEVLFYKLQYKYNYETDRQIKQIYDSRIEFNANILEPGLVQIDDANFYEKINNIMNDTERNSFNSSFNKSFAIATYSNLNAEIIKNTETIKIVDNKKYLNRIYIFNIAKNRESDDISLGNNYNVPFFENDNTYRNDYGFTENTLSLYNEFFDATGECKLPNIEGYDFYLMHDYKLYYGVFISKNTIDTFGINDVDDALKQTKHIEFNSSDNKYMLSKYRYSDVFLVNRMEIVKPEIPHFSADDIVVSKIANIKMPYITSYGSKWEYKKISLGGETLEPVYSKTNVGILSVEKNHIAYVSGYYDVIINYTVDDYFQHNRTLKAKIRINKPQ